MENKKDWEELEEWQMDQELKNISNKKSYAEPFDKKNIKGAEIFSKIFNFIAKSISITTVTIIIAVIAIAVLFVYTSFATVAPKNTVKYLKQVYGGEKFKIVENYSNNNGKGLYLLSPKSNKNIKFKAYNNANGIHDDYSAQRLKYYIDNCEDRNLIEGFNIEETKETYENEEFLQYNMNIELNNYNELSEKVQKVYQLVKYLNSRDNKMFESISIINKDINYYFSIQCYTTRNYEQELSQAKYKYINTLKEDNNQKELQKINQEEINEIWKPESLLLIINGKQMKLYNDGQARVFYVQEDGKYYMSGTDVILQQIEQIKILKKSKLLGTVKKLEYNNKKYKVKSSSGEGKNKNNVIYTGGTLEKFLENFNSEVTYDYENEKVYVIIK